ncbi:MAG: preprotein translocase subunit SecG [Lactobacillales bacterium]|jgi:preprotein translocase subunit SecG|nr:preprotein translocase subunit SecG [Lactobacillales bacterium]
METVILTVHIILAVTLTILVLMQKSEGGALGGLGGGQGAAGLFTGRQTGNFLSRATGYVFILFIVTSLTLAIIAKKTPHVVATPLIPTETQTNQ